MPAVLGTATFTLTRTPQPSAPPSPHGDPKVKLAAPVPQPQSGPLFNFAILIEGGTADTVTLKVYTRAYVCVASAQATGSFGPGWTPASFDLPGLVSGTYFTRVQAGVGGNLEKAGKAGRLVVLR